MIRYVIVSDLTTTVIDVRSANSLNAIDAAPSLHRNIVETDWVEGSNPAIGDQWDAQIPATFVTPALPTQLSEMTGDQLLDLQRQSTGTINAVADEIMRRRVQG